MNRGRLIAARFAGCALVVILLVLWLAALGAATAAILGGGL